MADHKAVPVSPAALIQVGGKNFSSMSSVQDLRSLQIAAAGEQVGLDPTAGLSKDTGAGGGPSVRFVQSAKAKKFSKGAEVQDKRTRRRGVIIKASAGYTKKTRTPVHELADDRGNTWLAKESDLDVLL